MRKITVTLAALLVALPIAGGALAGYAGGEAPAPVEEAAPDASQTPSQYYCCYIWLMGHWYCLPCIP